MSTINKASRGEASRPSTGSIETRSIEWIPQNERHGKTRHQGPFWFLTNFQPFTVALGLVGPALGLNLWWTIAAATLGVLFGTIFLALHGSQGPALGLPQMIQSRAQFGYRGVVVILLATVFTFGGYNVVDTVLLDSGYQSLFGVNPVVIGLFIGVIAILLAVWGHDWIHRAFRILFWISLPFWLLLTYGAVTGAAGGHPLHGLGFNVAAFATMFTIAASYNITYAPIVSDYTRYLAQKATSRALILTVYWGAAISAIWMIALGAWLGAQFGASETLSGLSAASNHILVGTGTILVIVGGLSLVGTMGINLYSASLTVLTAINSFHPAVGKLRRRVIVTIVVGVATTILGVAVVKNETDAINNVLLIMVYILAPWTAVNLVDYFVIRRGHYNIAEILNPKGLYGRWAWRGLTAYGLGVAAEIPFFVLTFYEGPVAKALQGVDISFAVALLVAGISYFIFARSNRGEVTPEATPEELRSVRPEQRPVDIAPTDA